MPNTFDTIPDDSKNIFDSIPTENTFDSIPADTSYKPQSGVSAVPKFTTVDNGMQDSINRLQAGLERDAAEKETPFSAGAKEFVKGVPAFGHRGGKALLAGMSDAAAAIRNIFDSDQLPVNSVSSFAENPTAPLPAEEGAEEMTGLSRFGEKALQSAIKVAPAIGATAGLGAAGLAPEAAASAPFLFNEKGQFDPVAGGLMAVLPAIGKLGSDGVAAWLKSDAGVSVPQTLAEAIYQSTGKPVTYETVANWLKAGGNQVAANAALMASQAPEIAQSDNPKQAFFDSLAGNIAPSLLAFAGHDTEQPSAAIDQAARQNLSIRSQPAEVVPRDKPIGTLSDLIGGKLEEIRQLLQQETVPPSVKGGAESELPPEAQAISKQNNSKAAFEALTKKQGATPLPQPPETNETEISQPSKQPQAVQPETDDLEGSGTVHVNPPATETADEGTAATSPEPAADTAQSGDDLGGQDKYGIAARVRDERAASGQVGEVEAGEGIAAKDSVERGRQLLDGGADPEKVMSDFEATKRANADDIAIARAHGENLASIARHTGVEFGEDSPQYKKAFDDLTAWDKRSKSMQTEWHKQGMAQQGETDVDTGSFTGLRRAYNQDTGRDFSQGQADRAKRIAKGVRAATEEADTAKSNLYRALENPDVEPHIKSLVDRIVAKLDKVGESALGRIKARRAEGRLMAGLDPVDLADHVIYGTAKIAKGLNDFGKWSKSMIDDLGDYVKPHLQEIWDAADKNLDNEVNGNKKAKSYLKREKVVDAEKSAIAAANKAVRDAAIRRVEAEKKQDLREAELKVAQRKESELADAKAAKSASDLSRKSAVESAKKARESLESGQPVKENPTADAEAKTAKSVSDASIRRARELAKQEAAKGVADAAQKLEQAKAEAKEAKAAQERINRVHARNATKMAEQARKEANTTTSEKLWAAAKDYIDKGIDSPDDIRNKLAADFGLPVQKVNQELARSANVKRTLDEYWRKQYKANQLKQRAKDFLKTADKPDIIRFLEKIPRAMFIAKVGGGLHGGVAIATHAPMIPLQARYWDLAVKNMIQMWKMVFSSTSHEQSMQDLVRSQNWTTARRAGLVNEPDYHEELVPVFQKYFGGLSGAGNRGYAVLKLLRQDIFDRQWNDLPKSAQTPEIAKAIADAVNHVTGVVRKGGLNSDNLIGKLATSPNIFFAPKLMASRASWVYADPLRATGTFSDLMLDKVTGGKLGKSWNEIPEGERYFALAQVKEKAWVLGTYFGLLAANQALLSAVGSNQKINFTDPMKSDWLKFKAAGMQMSYGNAMLNMVRLPMRVGQIAFSKPKPGRIRVYPDESLYTVGGEFARSQLSPAAATAVDLITKQDFQRRPLPNSNVPVPKRLAAQGVRPYTWKEYATEDLLPIPLQEGAKEVWRTGFGAAPEQQTQMLKAFATITAMGATGARLTEDKDAH